MEGSVVKPTIYIVTEPVMPLAEKVKELNLEGTQRFIFWKSFCILFAIQNPEYACKCFSLILCKGDCHLDVNTRLLICRDEYYAWGLHQIAKAVSFLNNDCKLVRMIYSLYYYNKATQVHS